MRAQPDLLITIEALEALAKPLNVDANLHLKYASTNPDHINSHLKRERIRAALAYFRAQPAHSESDATV